MPATPLTRLARPRSTQATGERSAARRARYRSHRARALPRAAVAHHARRRRPRARIARAPRRAIGHRARARLPSWNALRERVEELTLDFDAAAGEFVEAATDGRVVAPSACSRCIRASRARASTRALLLGDAATSSAHLAAHPELARARRAARLGAAPLRLPHLARRALRRARGGPGRDRAAAAGARRRREHAFPWLHHGVRPPGALGRGLRRRTRCRSPRCCSRPAPIRTTA